MESRRQDNELTGRGMGISIENYYELRATASILEHYHTQLGVVAHTTSTTRSRRTQSTMLQLRYSGVPISTLCSANGNFWSMAINSPFFSHPKI